MTIDQTVKKALDLSTEALNSLKEDGSVRKRIDKTIQDAFDTLVNTTQGFIDYVLNYVDTGFARCGPIMDVYDLVDNTLCYHILSPFNGIWTGIGLYLILFLPMLILSCMLEPLFRRYKKPAYQKEDHIEMMGNSFKSAMI